MTTTNIQPGELMIGNYLSHDEYGIGIVYEILIGNVWIQFENGYIIRMPYDQLNPIPLTEQWLLEFGFYTNEHPSGKSYQLDTEHGVTFWGRPKHGISAVDDYNNEIGEPVTFVHQLQNLYFALTATPLSREKGKGEGK